MLLDADDQRTVSMWLSDPEGHAVEVWVLEGSMGEKWTYEIRTLLNDLRNQTDFVVIDTKGSAGFTTSAAVVKSDLVYFPLQPSAADLWPIEKSLIAIGLSQEVRAGDSICPMFSSTWLAVASAFHSNYIFSDRSDRCPPKRN